MFSKNKFITDEGLELFEKHFENKRQQKIELIT